MRTKPFHPRPNSISNSSTTRRRVLPGIALASAAAIGLLGLGALPAAAAPGDVAIDVYTMNDFHGHLEASLGSGEAGAATVAGAYDQFKTANPNSILVSAGDNISGSPFISASQDDEPTIDALNTMGLKVSAIGNHELDHGRDDLAGRVEGLADFDLISANLFDKASGEHAFQASSVQNIGGIRVGFVGAVTEDLPSLVTPTGISTLDVAPIVDSVNAEAAVLKDGIDTQTNPEADVVILLIHEGATSATADVTDTSTVFGKIVMGAGPNFDAIASGHTHQLYSHSVDTGNGHTIPVLQTGSFGSNLGHIALTVDPNTKAITSISGETIPLVVGGVAAFPSDPAVATIVADAKAKANDVGKVEIGTITDSLTRAVQSDGSENRGGESDLGNLVADAQLSATADAGTQLAFMNPGGIRTDLTYAVNPSTPEDAPGKITYKEAADVQPFANTLITETLTGAQVKTVLEQQWQTGKTRPFLKLGINADLTYTYDPTAADGSHVTAIFFKGEPITPEQSFKVVVNNFLAAGGDNFLELANGTGKADTGKVDLDAFVDYMKASSPVSPDFGTRSIGITDTSKPAGTPIDLGTVRQGATFNFAFSSLVLSGAAVQDKAVNVLFDGAQIATAAIDPAIVDTFDEQGKATVSFAIPADAVDGAHEVTFQLSDTGVQLTYPVTVDAAAGGAGTDPAASGGHGSLAATGAPLFGAPLGLAAALFAAGGILALRRRKARA